MPIIYIDGDNIMLKELSLLLPAVRSLHPNARILYYHVAASISSKALALLETYNVTYIPVTVQRNQATDIYMIYHISYLSSRLNTQHYVISNDKAFKTLTSLNPHIHVLTTKTTAPELRLKQHMQTNGLVRISLGDAGIILQPKLNGFKSTREQLLHSKLFKVKNHQVRLQGVL